MNDQAISRFMALRGEVATLLAEIGAAADDHFGYSPDTINWGHVGTLERVRGLLSEAHASAITETAYSDALRAVASRKEG